MCKSFVNSDQVKFVNTLGCLDPLHDVMWQYLPERNVIKCYNKLTIEAKNLKECSIYDSIKLKDMNELTIESIANADHRSLSVLSSELAIPKIENTLITRSQLAMHILACFDTFYISRSMK